jgi:hypothetical protein
MTAGNQGKPLRPCPYCGRYVLTARETVCKECDDLPALDPVSSSGLGLRT